MENVPDKKEPRQKELAEIQLALAMAIDKLENPRQRAVMRLSLLGYDYQEIKDMLIAKNDEIGRNLTYEKVRYAHEKGLEALRKWFRPPAA
jgi:DNA-directed RNA polymerase specialized sigma24 family protein